MPRPKAKRLGVGAIAQCKAKFLKPKKPVKEKYPNTYGEEVISNLNVLGKDKKIIRKKEMFVVKVSHIDFDDQE